MVHVIEGFLAELHEVPPEGDVLAVEGMQPRRLVPGSAGDVRVFLADPIDLAIQPRQLADRIAGERFPVEEVLVPVEDHAKLRAPVADVVVALHVVAGEAEQAIQGRSDHRTAEMAHVHGLGDVGGGEIDDHVPGHVGERHAQPLVGHQFSERPLEPGRRQREVDEAGAGDLRRLAAVGDVQVRQDAFGDLARRLAELFGQRHRAVGLVVAEFRVLGGFDEVGQVGGLVRKRRQGGGEAAPEESEQIHAVFELSR